MEIPQLFRGEVKACVDTHVPICRLKVWVMLERQCICHTGCTLCRSSKADQSRARFVQMQPGITVGSYQPTMLDLHPRMSDEHVMSEGVTYRCSV